MLLVVEVEDHTLVVAVVLVDFYFMEVQQEEKQQTDQHFQLVFNHIQ